ncbi:MAG: response regulator [Lachnospiraceae bacterium]|nr:response regulator [Lachnospiraceae bacterium]
MYHCKIRSYFVGHRSGTWEVLKEMPPLACFTHEFIESAEPEEALAARADVILADLREMDEKEALRILVSGKKKEAELILLMEKDGFAYLEDDLSEVKDIWLLPMSEKELRFRFLRWQESCKMNRDFRQTSHYLEATINSVPNLIWYKDKNGIHEKVNDSFCRTVNKTKQQVEGQGHAYIWNVEHDDPVCIESEREVMNRRETIASEETIQTGEGTRLLTTYKSPLYDFDGSVMGTVGVAIDVTQERAYEQEIISKNHTLESLFMTIDCGVMCHTLDGSRIISINRAALRLLGYESQEELVAEGFDLVASSVVEEDRLRLQECIRSLKKAEDSVGIEYRVLHKDGKILHIMGNVKLIEENGELFYQRFLLDCTAQKLREQKERTENERHQMELIQALSIDYRFVCFFDLDTGRGMPLRIDENTDGIFAAVFNRERSFKESMEAYIEQYVYEEDREMLRETFSQEQLKEALSDKKTCYINYRFSMNGEIKYYQIKTVRAGAWDERRGIVLGFRNVDEETRNEMKKKELLETALFQAKRANKAKSVFLSNMSHDIRTPMNAIVGFTTLAITHIDRREQVEEYLKKILTSGNHLVSLINDVLDMSRIESGKMHLEETLCNLPDILHGLRSIVQADVRAKQLDLYIDTVDVLDEEIYCDKLRLNQVLLNLLGNSIKYTGAGGMVSMRITEKAGAPSGYANYEFVIKDTGIGMSEEFVAHIFEPFERERNSTISRIQGTGLGMAITKNIVDMMDGAIEVRSEQGAGTEFILSLTFRLHSQKKVVQTIPELKGCRALVVDDDFSTCDSVSYMLQQFGMRAEWTLSGKEAILRTRQAIMRNDAYSVYLIDWIMPDMNGVEVARRIRKETGENVPIIVLTAYDWSDIEDEARDAGVSAFCSKPLFQSELRTCLHAIVNTEETEGNEEKQEIKPLHTGCILLAEDNELNQEITTALLKEAGFSVEVADNGQAAVDRLTEAGPDYYCLVLMDVQMPVMNGYEATKKIRGLADPKLAQIPILAMTANAFEEDRQEALRCGMNGHIAKPINIDKMWETLEQILG